MKFCLASSKPKVTMQERKSFDFALNVLYEKRYCYQDDFSVLVYGGIDKNYEVVKSTFKFYCPKFKI